MLDDTSNIPLYRQLSELLFSKIKSGEWGYNYRLPTEFELCEQYKISRMTVRLALEELRKGGYIYRKQGRGTFVGHPKIEQKLSSFYSFTEEIEEKGYKITKKILYFAPIPADDKLATKLDLKNGEKVLKIFRVLYCNDLPFAAESSFIPAHLCTGIKKKDVETKGLYRTLETYNIKPNMASEVYETIILDKEYQELLEVPKNTPGFFLERLSLSGDLPVEFCESYVSGKMVKYNVVLS